jgi:calcium/calmodulin-dependent protein kinase (CaM kinase) II
MAADRAESTEQELLKLTRQLLDSISAADWAAYEKLCDPTITCFEPEARGHLVPGMAFHRYYFDLGAASGPRNTTIVDPHVRVMGDSAVVSYVRLVQRLGADGKPATATVEETRVWQKQGGAWKHVHFHRSENR